LSLLQNVQTSSEVHPASYTMGTGLKLPGQDFDHSLPSSTQVKNGRSCTSNPTICLHGVERVNFTFTLTCHSTMHGNHRKQVEHRKKLRASALPKVTMFVNVHLITSESGTPYTIILIFILK
jgi:hypothetical protein